MINGLLYFGYKRLPVFEAGIKTTRIRNKSKIKEIKEIKAN